MENKENKTTIGDISKPDKINTELVLNKEG